jgi:hypothetical protein
MLSATSAGLTETGDFYHNKPGELFPQQTFYDQLSKEGFKWRHYYNDTPWEVFMAGVTKNLDNVKPITEFYEDARNGNLPAFAFINPRLSANTTTKRQATINTLTTMYLLVRNTTRISMKHCVHHHNGTRPSSSLLMTNTVASTITFLPPLTYHPLVMVKQVIPTRGSILTD